MSDIVSGEFPLISFKFEPTSFAIENFRANKESVVGRNPRVMLRKVFGLRVFGKHIIARNDYADFCPTVGSTCNVLAVLNPEVPNANDMKYEIVGTIERLTL